MFNPTIFSPLEARPRSLAARFFSSRATWIGFWVAVVALKLLSIFHLRADSDEPQHAHVVWAWATDRLQYRDVFDNHMPLFQMACAPLFGLIGERADILIYLRLAMLPLYLVSSGRFSNSPPRFFPARRLPGSRSARRFPLGFSILPRSSARMIYGPPFGF